MFTKNEQYLNPIIDSLLTPLHTIGAAAEIRLGVITLRGGATIINSAQTTLGQQIQTGLGASIKSSSTSYFVSYGRIIRNKQYFMYSADYTNAVSYSNSLSSLNSETFERLHLNQCSNLNRFPTDPHDLQVLPAQPPCQK